MTFRQFKDYIKFHTFIGKHWDSVRMGYFQSGLTLGRVLAFDPKRVVFSSFSGRSYSDNPRCISEKLHEMYPEAHICWLLREPKKWRDKVPDYVRIYRANRWMSGFILGTARVWVDNFSKLVFPNRKMGQQIYMQTWHGDRAFKKIGYDNNTVDYYRLEETCDVFLTGSTFGQNLYRSAFHYTGPFLNYGCPRNDILVRNDPAEAAAVRKKLGISADTKLLLYAPTYRDTKAIIPKEAQMDLLHTLEQLEKTTGQHWMCLYRAHYMTNGIDLSSVQHRLIDMTSYDSMSELLLIADMLLTDYSSSAMDYAIMDKPVLLYQADIADYVSHREMYYSMDETPFLVAQNQDELDQLIADITPERAAENCRAIRAYFGFNETGHSTEEACKYIIDKLEHPPVKQ